IRARAAEAPERPAIIGAAGATLSRGDLIERVEQMAQRIERATPDGSVVGLLLPNSAGLVVAFLACLGARRIVFPLHPATPAPEIDELRARCGLAALVRPSSPGPTVEPLEPIACADRP